MQEIQTLEHCPIGEGVQLLQALVRQAYSDPFSERTSAFLTILPKVFQIVFGAEGAKGWIDKLYENLSKPDVSARLGQKVRADFDLLLLFLSPSNASFQQNLFTLVHDKFGQIRYEFYCSNLPAHLFAELMEDQLPQGKMLSAYF